VLIILVFDAIISPIISILTLFKAALFTTIVRIFEKLLYHKPRFYVFVFKIIITFIVGLQHQIPTKTDFSYTGDSLLMSLIALGRILYYVFLNTLI